MGKKFNTWFTKEVHIAIHNVIAVFLSGAFVTLIMMLFAGYTSTRSVPGIKSDIKEIQKSIVSININYDKRFTKDSAFVLSAMQGFQGEIKCMKIIQENNTDKLNTIINLLRK
jgi:hypothetical protein